MTTETNTLDPLTNLLGEVRRLIEAKQPEQARELLAGHRALDPGTSIGWRALAGAWRAAGAPQMAADAQLRAIEAALREPDMAAAKAAMTKRDYAAAERLLKERLAARPSDAAALAMLGDLAVRARHFEDADRLLTRALEIAPGFRPARQSLAFAHYSRSRTAEGLEQVALILNEVPSDIPARELKGALLIQRGDEEAAIELLQKLLAEAPDGAASSWLRLGHALKSVGRTDEGIAAYRQAIARDISVGETWWSLANLKTFRFTDADVTAMRALVANPGTSHADRAATEFALGKAMEDAKEDETAFAHYSRGNALRRETTPYDAEETTTLRHRCETLFDAAFFAARPGGCPSPEPIFVVGMPRSGSTLVEQIIGSHPLVESTRELSFLTRIIQRIDDRAGKDATGHYPEILATLTPEQRYAMGREYLDRAGAMRRTERPYFIDKMPNNFHHVGLIQLILPNARIVDARRHPMATGFSCFKQSFAHHQQFSYELTELGRYYVDYVELMRAYDRALPGRVHRVVNERLIADVEGEVRALLDYLHLPFDAACLSPHENAGAIRTPSAEQVRQPIGNQGTNQWRRFDRHLGPLRDALGPVIDSYADPIP
ncbi:sulfotransferase [Sphingomonas sp. SUN019]|uniref:tetratricopeptide repeat-containing sulfotransferase family protein n=1 Tax=Sphingomonas sp. SUN019 TaxID=2937788 RepID=UPI0021648BE2|nr:tetratricopeptide repeat-containing sulfotransferase family protein [Sphingomonas sp. SUN019]UVO49359.1 sulfotransferase [Sphingomonas sp. SUN019]